MQSQAIHAHNFSKVTSRGAPGPCVAQADIYKPSLNEIHQPQTKIKIPKIQKDYHPLVELIMEWLLQARHCICKIWTAICNLEATILTTKMFLAPTNAQLWHRAL